MRAGVEYVRMPQAPKLLALLAALLIAALLSGCGSSNEPSVAAAIVKSGVLGSLGDELQRDDDADEVQELRELEPQSPAEREEMREQREELAVEAAQAAERGDLETAQLEAQAAEQAEAGEGSEAGPGGEAIASTGEGEGETS